MSAREQVKARMVGSTAWPDEANTLLDAFADEVRAEAGVELGAYDERIVRWFAGFADGGTYAVIASWVKRAARE